MKVNPYDRLTLGVGAHKRSGGDGPQEMCVMEAVAWLAGEEHNDRPICTDLMIAGPARVWNDRCSQNFRARAKELIPWMIGTSTFQQDISIMRGWVLVDCVYRRLAPASLRMMGLEGLAERLERLPKIVNADIRATAVRIATASGCSDCGVGELLASDDSGDPPHCREMTLNTAEESAESLASRAALDLGPTLRLRYEEFFFQCLMDMCRVGFEDDGSPRPTAEDVWSEKMAEVGS